MIAALAELSRQVRHGTLQLLHAPDRSWLVWTPPGTSNHILWHAGHALWVQDALSVRPLTGVSELPRGWVELFGQNSSPNGTGNWPDETALLKALDAQLLRILELYDQHADTIAVNATEVLPGGGWPLLAGIIHGWHDEARHQGEMYLLHKLHRMQT